ncbi:MAG TPA: uroporphyrinogen decarboxylase family protein [Bryobacteraceae bacterium]|nr:uroporphyrinogen decarboxylase family protein [Bryobacteraceae bacterium]HPT26430.1 uroporphyrinogen decarboxylase family protein [Bryobacteraceae bacterium]
MLNKVMNGYQRTRATLEGARPAAPPVMLHNFMMAAAESGVSMGVFRSDPVQMARCFTESIERYGLDGIMVDVDTATLAGAVGVPVVFPDDEPAVCRGELLSSLNEVRDLPPVDIGRYPGVQVWLEAVRIIKRHFGDEIYLRGNCDQCPFSLAAHIRGASGWMMDLMDPGNEADAHALLDFCTDITTQFIRLMAATGAHMVSNGDSSSGPSVVSPRIYRTFAQPYEKRVVEVAHQLGVPYALHICGKTDQILLNMVETGSDALELDSKTDASRAAEVLGDRATFIGNLDPTTVLAHGTPRLVEERTRALLHTFSGTRRFILNAGCAIVASTPPENIRAMVHIAKQGYEETA